MKYDVKYSMVKIFLALTFLTLIFSFKSKASDLQRLSVSGDFPPYFSMDDGKANGLCVDWFNDISRILNEQYPSEAGVIKNAGVIFEFTFYPEEGENTMSVPVRELRWLFLCRLDSAVKSLKSLKWNRLALVKGSYGGLGPIEGATYSKNTMEALLELVSGSKDYILLPELTAKHIIRELGEEGFAIKSFKMPSGFIFLNVRGNISKEGAGAVIKAVHEFRKSGTSGASLAGNKGRQTGEVPLILAYAGFMTLLIIGATVFSFWSFFKNRLKKAMESEGSLSAIFRATVNTIDDLLFVIDRDFRVVRTNLHKFRKNLELSSGQTFCYELIRNQQAPCSDCRISEIFETGKPMNFMDDECGMGVFRDCRVVPFFDHSGKVSGIIKVLKPIEERRHFDMMQFLKLVFDVVSEEVIVTGDSYSIIYVNRAYERSSNGSMCDFIGKHPAFFEKKLQEHDDYKSLTQSLLQGCSWHGYLNEYIKENGDVLRKEVFVSPFSPDKDGPRFFIFIAAPSSISSKLKHSNRVELLGFIAGAITHDFNNILMMIMSNAELAGGLYSGGGKVDNALKRIINTGTHAKHLVENIEYFYKRREKVRRSPLCLKKIIQDAADEIEIILPANISFEKNISESTWPVRADETEIYQIILNLCINAVNAMRDGESGGRLIISLNNVDSENELIIEGLSDREKISSFVKLSVSDTGIGMDMKTANRIYEPFFTARLTEKGAGLGLAIIKNIVDEMDGEISVRSAPGKGTTFDIYFRRCSKEELAELSDSPTQGGKARV
ncbi:MAG: hypothetical protein A2020_13545 [Lentisphaerae bacterium GWF2_45_14]|nr:MAG: hypothetical protein A2020_13545 [Lentisphaerae bacterium GWF2_45_14]